MTYRLGPIWLVYAYPKKKGTLIITFPKLEDNQNVTKEQEQSFPFNQKKYISNPNEAQQKKKGLNTNLPSPQKIYIHLYGKNQAG